jgi:hypothetical protein
MAKKLTNKEMTNGIMNNFNNLNLLANYINDFIEFQDQTENFKVFIQKKYERMTNGQPDQSNTDGNRENKSGDTNPDTKSTKARKIVKDGANKDKASKKSK